MTGWRKRKIQEAQKELFKETDDLYVEGWNDALETVSHKLINDFKQSFADDTLALIAVWLRGNKL